MSTMKCIPDIEAYNCEYFISTRSTCHISPSIMNCTSYDRCDACNNQDACVWCPSQRMCMDVSEALISDECDNILFDTSQCPDISSAALSTLSPSPGRQEDFFVNIEDTFKVKSSKTFSSIEMSPLIGIEIISHSNITLSGGSDVGGGTNEGTIVLQSSNVELDGESSITIRSNASSSIINMSRSGDVLIFAGAKHHRLTGGQIILRSGLSDSLSSGDILLRTPDALGYEGSAGSIMIESGSSWEQDGCVDIKADSRATLRSDELVEIRSSQQISLSQSVNVLAERTVEMNAQERLEATSQMLILATSTNASSIKLDDTFVSLESENVSMQSSDFLSLTSQNTMSIFSRDALSFNSDTSLQLESMQFVNISSKNSIDISSLNSVKLNSDSSTLLSSSTLSLISDISSSFHSNKNMQLSTTVANISILEGGNISLLGKNTILSSSSNTLIQTEEYEELSGMLRLSTGHAKTRSGDVDIDVGSTQFHDGSNVYISAGKTYSDQSTGGRVQIRGGSGMSRNTRNGGRGGSISMKGGEANGGDIDDAGGSVEISGGIAERGRGGDIKITSGVSHRRSSGTIVMSSVKSSRSGGIAIQTGDSESSTSGAIRVETGQSTNGSGGSLNFRIGEGTFGDGGLVKIKAGESTMSGSRGGDVMIDAGLGSSMHSVNGGDGGEIYMKGGVSLGTSGTDNGGAIALSGGNAFAGFGGSLLFASGTGTSSGHVAINTADSGDKGVSGGVVISTGDSKSGDSGTSCDV